MEVRRQEEGTWDVGWEGHERAQLLRMAAMPLPLKLRWLEEAQVTVETLQAQWKQTPPGRVHASERRQEGGPQ